MDYVEGVTLATLHAHGAMAPDVALRIAYDVLLGLSAAHSLRLADGSLANLVHRDVSPQNVLVESDGYARLGDFGIARSDERITRTHTGVMKGRLAYMSPERLARTADRPAHRSVRRGCDLVGGADGSASLRRALGLADHRVDRARSCAAALGAAPRARATRRAARARARSRSRDPLRERRSHGRGHRRGSRRGSEGWRRLGAWPRSHSTSPALASERSASRPTWPRRSSTPRRSAWAASGYRELASQEASLERRRASSRPPDLIFDPLATRARRRGLRSTHAHAAPDPDGSGADGPSRDPLEQPELSPSRASLPSAQSAPRSARGTVNVPDDSSTCMGPSLPRQGRSLT